MLPVLQIVAIGLLWIWTASFAVCGYLLWINRKASPMPDKDQWLRSCGRVHWGPICVEVTTPGKEAGSTIDIYGCRRCKKFITPTEHHAYLKTHYASLDVMAKALLEARKLAK